jgi:hypothetical protein
MRAAVALIFHFGFCLSPLAFCLYFGALLEFCARHVPAGSILLAEHGLTRVAEAIT